jgi:hypothetical protein
MARSKRMAYRSDYPSEPIGGGNPYYRCKHCKRSAPEINGDVYGHYEWCAWRKEQERTVNPVDAIRAALALMEGDDPEDWHPEARAILRNAVKGEG